MTTAGALNVDTAMDAAFALSPSLDWDAMAPVVGVYIGGEGALNVWTPEEVAALAEVPAIKGFMPIYVPDQSGSYSTGQASGDAMDAVSRLGLYDFDPGGIVVVDIEEEVFNAIGGPEISSYLSACRNILDSFGLTLVAYGPSALADFVPPMVSLWGAFWPYGSTVPPSSSWPVAFDGPLDAWQCAGNVSVQGVQVDTSYLHADFPLSTKGKTMPNAPINYPPQAQPQVAPSFTTTPQVPGEPEGVPPVQDQSEDTSFTGATDLAAVVAVFPLGPGFVVVRQDGSVEAMKGAPFYGSFDSLPISETLGITPDFVGGCPVDGGYVLVHASFDPTTGAGLYYFDESTKPA